MDGSQRHSEVAERSSMNRDWWRGAALYQVYPRSYADANGDGVGDLAGITQRLDHIADLNMDGIWISPFFKSPMRDFGYDVSDYCDVDPIFGTLEDFDLLVEKAHGLGLKVVIDMVLSHSSVEHPWFQQSRMTKDGNRSDWYVWADPRPDGTPPTNWQSVFTGPAWTWDARRKQYYLHNFLSTQPDLNVRNPEVQDALLRIMRFWLDRGVDGFRLDALNFYMHNPNFLDNPPVDDATGAERPFDYQQRINNRSHPDIFPFLAKLRAEAENHGAVFLLAEIGDQSSEEEMIDYAEYSEGVHSSYSFVFLGDDPLTPALIKDAFAPWLRRSAWPTWTFSNHDAPRAVSRFGRDGNIPAIRQLFALLAAMRGTLILYQGEEGGMVQAHVPYEALQDPEAMANWPLTKGRDGARTPLVWNTDVPLGGFSARHDVQPWLPVDPRHLTAGLEDQASDPGSAVSGAREIFGYRRGERRLTDGELAFLDDLDDDCLGVIRWPAGDEDKKLLCLFNLSAEPREVPADMVGDIRLAQGFDSLSGDLSGYGFVFAEYAE